MHILESSILTKWIQRTCIRSLPEKRIQNRKWNISCGSKIRLWLYKIIFIQITRWRSVSHARHFNSTCRNYLFSFYHSWYRHHRFRIWIIRLFNEIYIFWLIICRTKCGLLTIIWFFCFLIKIYFLTKI